MFLWVTLRCSPVCLVLGGSGEIQDEGGYASVATIGGIEMSKAFTEIFAGLADAMDHAKGAGQGFAQSGPEKSEGNY